MSSASERHKRKENWLPVAETTQRAEHGDIRTAWLTPSASTTPGIKANVTLHMGSHLNHSPNEPLFETLVPCDHMWHTQSTYSVHR